MKIIDKNKRFSESLLWKLQSDAYTNFGVEAWTEKGVPSYLTSNPYTAKQYAQAALGYLRDSVRRGAIDFSKPVYIFDLGAGTGRFGYLFLKHLLEWIEQLPLRNIQVRYVMTDMVEKNLAFLQSHPYLQDLIDHRYLDFALYHHGYIEEPLVLRNTQEVLTPGSLQNPAIVIGNYFFDTIPQDLFKVQAGKLHEGRITISSPIPYSETHPDPSIISGMECRYDYVPIEDASDYFPGNKDVNRLLHQYAANFEGVPFLFPSGAFQTLDYFSRLSQNRYLMLAGDQGVCTDKQVKEWGEPQISRHGSFSISVSYHAIAEYFRMRGGTGLLTTLPDPLFVVIAAAADAPVEEMQELRFSFLQSFDSFEPSDYWKIVLCCEREWKTPPLDLLLLLIKIGNWDPINFHAFFPAIHAQLPKASPQLRDDLCYTIDRVWQQFYPVSPQEGEFVMNLGVLLYEMEQPEKALVYFERALKVAGDRADIWKNMGVCYAALQDTENALACFQKAKSLK